VTQDLELLRRRAEAWCPPDQNPLRGLRFLLGYCVGATAAVVVLVWRMML
jgi:hypothetical protein